MLKPVSGTGRVSLWIKGSLIEYSCCATDQDEQEIR